MADPSPLVLPEDPQKQLHLLAFYDFCLNLFEEGFGKIPPEEKESFFPLKDLFV